jgi:hypothetical protein
MNVKYQIFVSSTYEDLKDERAEVIKACLNMGHIPVGMEMFNAADEEQWAVITRTIDQCDYYVVIVAHRYGSTVDGISFTEKEYDYAVERGVPVLGFVIEDGASWPNDRIDKDQAAIETLQAFKYKVKQKIVRSWRDKSELQAAFAMSLSTYININPRRGWTRAPEGNGADIAQALSNLTEENARLRQALKESQKSSSVRGRIDDIVDIIVTQTLNHSGHKVNSVDFVWRLISFISKKGRKDGYALELEIFNELSDYDPAETEDLLDQLVILNVIGQDSGKILFNCN